MILSRNSGCHTAAFSKPRQGYHALQSLADDAYERGYQVQKEHDKYNLNHTYKLKGLSERGVKLTICQFATHPGFARLKLTFGSLLSGKFDPMRLYKGEEDEWADVQRAYNSLLSLDGLPDKLNKLALARLDVTEDIELSSGSEMDRMVYVMRKSMKSTKYHRVKFKRKDKHVDDPAEANSHSMEYCTQTTRKDKKRQKTTGIQPQTAFKAYNKTYDMERKGWSECIEGNTLRLELTHTGPAIKRKLKLGKDASNKEVVNAAAQQAHELIWRFMKSGMFTEGRFYRYDHTIQEIQQAPGISKRNRLLMMELCYKVSECGNLGNAMKRMKLGEKKQSRLLKLFAWINLSPVTLPNEGTPKQLPSIAELMCKDIG